MSFYHILLSNGATDRFPANQAAKFSIPIDDDQQLTGDWEVAIAQLAHSNCLYTFHREVMTVCESCAATFQCKEGCRVYIPQWPNPKRAREFIINFLNEACQNIMTLTLKSRTKITRHIRAGWIVCFSERLRSALGFSSNALTSYDTYVDNHVRRRADVIYEEDAYYVDIVSMTTLEKNIILKPKNTDMLVDTLVKKFNFQLQLNGQQVAKMSYRKSGHIVIEKLQEDDLVLVCSPAFHTYLSHRTAAVHGKSQMKFLAYNPSRQYTNDWSVALYRKTKEPLALPLKKTKVLLPHVTSTVEDAIDYLNHVMDDKRIRFTATDAIASVTVGGNGLTLTIDDTLKDILGFDVNTFTSGQTIKGSGKVSLSRRIHYFQIYSNIGVDVRVGDTAAPLLAMIPYNPKECTTLSERHFRKLHYISLKSNYIPQIDISMYDDAGELVPFHEDAVTSLTLHFRRKI